MYRVRDEKTTISSSESTTMTQTPNGPQIRSETTEVRAGMHCAVRATELRRALRNAALFPPTRKWKSLDELRGIRLEVSGTDLIIMAADGRVLTRETTAVNTPAPAPAQGKAPRDGMFILKLADAKVLINMLARDRPLDVALTVTETRQSWTWEEPRANRKASGAPAVTRTLTAEIADKSAPVKAEFSELDSETVAQLDARHQKLLDDHEPGNTDAIAFDPTRLARFARVVPAKPAYAMEVLLAGATKVAKVRIGGHFTAWIMPITMPPTHAGRPRPSRFPTARNIRRLRPRNPPLHHLRRPTVADRPP